MVVARFGGGGRGVGVTRVAEPLTFDAEVFLVHGVVVEHVEVLLLFVDVVVLYGAELDGVAWADLAIVKLVVTRMPLAARVNVAFASAAASTVAVQASQAAEAGVVIVVAVAEVYDIG